VRLFVAIDVSDETRAQLRRVREQLAHRLTTIARRPRVTWVAEEAAHVTIRFIGEVPDSVVEQVRAAMAPPLAGLAYTIEFSGVGVFPKGARPRVVWIGANRGQEETAAVAAAVHQRLDPIIGVGESRPFRAHLTLARVKEPKPFDWSAALATIDAGRTRSLVDHVTLYQSRTSPAGPTYTPLCTTWIS
jgi:RNA 2',3'-cyclic 3'-phosphodiesterase